MVLIDLIKVMDGDVRIRVYENVDSCVEGEVDELLNNGRLTTKMLNKEVANIYHSKGYNAITVLLG